MFSLLVQLFVQDVRTCSNSITELEEVFFSLGPSARRNSHVLAAMIRGYGCKGHWRSALKLLLHSRERGNTAEQLGTKDFEYRYLCHQAALDWALLGSFGGQSLSLNNNSSSSEEKNIYLKEEGVVVVDCPPSTGPVLVTNSNSGNTNSNTNTIISSGGSPLGGGGGIQGVVSNNLERNTISFAAIATLRMCQLDGVPIRFPPDASESNGTTGTSGEVNSITTTSSSSKTADHRANSNNNNSSTISINSSSCLVVNTTSTSRAGTSSINSSAHGTAGGNGYSAGGRKVPGTVDFVRWPAPEAHFIWGSGTSAEESCCISISAERGGFHPTASCTSTAGSCSSSSAAPSPASEDSETSGSSSRQNYAHLLPDKLISTRPGAEKLVSISGGETAININVTVQSSCGGKIRGGFSCPQEEARNAPGDIIATPLVATSTIGANGMPCDDVAQRMCSVGVMKYGCEDVMWQ